jgi:large subunit ribosomal protein L18e
MAEKTKQISKTKIEKRLRKKANPELVETIIKLKKTNPEMAKQLVMPVRKQRGVNLEKIDKETKQGENILILGKVLSSGHLSKKIKIVALSVSEKALEKLNQEKIEIVKINEEIKTNPELKNLRIIK